VRGFCGLPYFPYDPELRVLAVLDSVKGADLGLESGRLVLDFNFAYNPSCSYDSRWACPLCPPPNRLSTPIRAGERVS
jgi:hypothetical protein